MTTGVNTRPFARALLTNAVKNGTLEAVRKDIEDILEQWDGSPALREFCKQTHTGTPAEHAANVDAVWGDTLSPGVIHILRQMAVWGCLPALRSLAADFLELYETSAERPIAKIEFAAFPSEEDLRVLKEKLEKKYNGPVETAVFLNPELLAGFRLTVRDRMLDASLLGRVKRLKNLPGLNGPGLENDSRSISSGGIAQLKPDEVSALIRHQLEAADKPFDTAEFGVVLSVGDGMARLDGLSSVMFNELLETDEGIVALALNLEEYVVGAAILDDGTKVKEGDRFRRTGRVVSAPVGEALTGRVLDALGRPLDGLGAVKADGNMPVDVDSPSIIERKDVNTPLATGIIAIDALTPIGRGQRELIIGDRKTGKTTIAIDAILNQAGKGVHCFYVSVGQKMSSVASIHSLLKERGAMSYTTIVVATASDPAPLQYIAPYTACTMAEYWRDRGGHALVVYDDLTKHAQSYRQMSLLLRRPPGREAFPGDIFYLHSRLLERAAQLSDAKGGGSLTALPIVETQANDISAYIPTNVISITDGQIFLETGLFYEGQRPAMNPGISVSRVGGDAQVRAMKATAGPLRTQLAVFRELEAFSRYSSDLDSATLDQIALGRSLMRVLRQLPNSPMDVEKQVAVLHAATRKLFVTIPENRIDEAVYAIYRAIDETDEGKAYLKRFAALPEMDDDLKAKLDAVYEKCLPRFSGRKG